MVMSRPVVPLMSVGGKGVVSVVANIAPKKMADLCKAMQSGDLKTAQGLHSELYKLCKSMFCETNPIPCKAAGAMMGKWKQNFRLPMTKLQAQNEAPIKAALQAAGLM